MIYFNLVLVLQESLTHRAIAGEITPKGIHDIVGMTLPNKEYPGQVRDLRKHHNWSNTWNDSQLKGFAKQVQTNFNIVQEKMMAFQHKCEML